MEARKQVDTPSVRDREVNRPKRRRIGAEARHSQLIEVAERVFVEDGYERASMEHIADEAGVTRTLVYQHFPAKRDLYMAVLDRVIPEFVKRVIPPVEVRPKYPWRLLAGFRAFLALLEEEGSAINLLLGERPHEPWLAEQIKRLYRMFIEHFEHEFEGRAQPESVRLIATCYLGMLEAVARSWPADKRIGLDAEEVARLLSQLVWDGLRGMGIPEDMVDEQYADEPPGKWRPDLEYLEKLAEKVPGSMRTGESRIH